jgi:hypothetical protein
LDIQNFVLPSEMKTKVQWSVDNRKGTWGKGYGLIAQRTPRMENTLKIKVYK